MYFLWMSAIISSFFVYFLIQQEAQDLPVYADEIAMSDETRGYADALARAQLAWHQAAQQAWKSNKQTGIINAATIIPLVPASDISRTQAFGMQWQSAYIAGASRIITYPATPIPDKTSPFMVGQKLFDYTRNPAAGVAINAAIRNSYTDFNFNTGLPDGTPVVSDFHNM